MIGTNTSVFRYKINEVESDTKEVESDTKEVEAVTTCEVKLYKNKGYCS